MSKFENKLRKRTERYIVAAPLLTDLANIGEFTVVAYKKFKGLRISDRQTILPVYDDLIVTQSYNVGGAVVDGSIALIDLFSGELLTDFDISSIEFDDNQQSIILIRDGLRGLFDMAQRRIVLDTRYETITREPGTRFSWTFSPHDGYAIIDRLSDNKIELGHGIEACFDECHGHIFVVRGGTVRMLDYDGMEDAEGYRKLLVKLGGRLTLYNSTFAISVIADVYGNIL